jgi:hypothetical protein
MNAVHPIFQPIVDAFNADWVSTREVMAAAMRAAMTPEDDAYEAGYQRATFHIRNHMPFDATPPCDVSYTEWRDGYCAGWSGVTA